MLSLLGKSPSPVQSHIRSRVSFRRVKHTKSPKKTNVTDDNTTAQKKVSRQLFGCGGPHKETVPKKVYAQNTNATCVSCHRIFTKIKVRILKEHQYPNAQVHIQHILKNFDKPDDCNAHMHICKPCHHALSKGHLPRKAASSPYKKYYGGNKCCVCLKMTRKEYILFDMSVYDNQQYVSLKVQQFTQMICLECHHVLKKHKCQNCSVCNTSSTVEHLKKDGTIWLCQKCDSNAKYKLLDCAVCLIKMSRDIAIKLEHEKYDQVQLSLLELLSCAEKHICQSCHETLLTVCCVCCDKFTHNMCVSFQFDNYDYSNYLVAEMLSFQYIGNGANMFLCKSCHMALQYTNTSIPHIPKKAKSKYEHLHNFALFLQKIQQTPTFGCTVCHRWMFQTNVVVFHESKYDMTNDIVAKCCANRFVRKILLPDDTVPANISSSNCSSKQQTTQQIFRYEREYICNRCHNALKKKVPSMPKQAVANDLQLDDIPAELQDITDLERRLISLRIPFMKLCSLKKYGCHFKINGPCVNVPASLDHITTVLPRMSTEIQLHPVVLKRRIDHKSEYMRHDIRRDKVAGMINWLKTYNQDYLSVTINKTWYESFASNKTGIDLLQCDTLEETTKPIDNENTHDSTTFLNNSLPMDDDLHTSAIANDTTLFPGKIATVE